MIVVYSVIGLLAVFSASLIAIVLSEMVRMRRRRRAHSDATEPEHTREGWIARYTGPVDRSRAPLTPAARVLIEFTAGMLGFPGIGWMTSGYFAVGLPLLVVVPAALWMFFPLYISTAAVVLEKPLAGLVVLPAIALASASMLARAEHRDVRREMVAQR